MGRGGKGRRVFFYKDLHVQRIFMFKRICGFSKDLFLTKGVCFKGLFFKGLDFSKGLLFSKGVAFYSEELCF